jgi:hypothetical protein
MGYWKLTDPQRETLQGLVRGKTVVDLGSGDMSLSLEMLAMGAQHVTAVDPHSVSQGEPNLTVVPSYYRYLKPIQADLGVLSWPWCSTDQLEGLIGQLDAYRQVVYLGTNSGGLACGHPRLFRYTLTRELIRYEPAPQNNMLVLGTRLATPREPTGEEAAGIDTGNLYSYRDTIGSRWRDVCGPDWKSKWGLDLGDTQNVG